MTEEQARKRCAELAETSAERQTHSWIPRQKPDGSWGVVKLAVPPATAPETVKTVSSKEQAAKDDPRTAMEQSFPPYTAGI